MNVFVKTDSTLVGATRGTLSCAVFAQYYYHSIPRYFWPRQWCVCHVL